MNLRKLMLAVTAQRTAFNYTARHYYSADDCLVDKDHIDICELLAGKHAPTYFNKLLCEDNLMTQKA